MIRPRDQGGFVLVSAVILLTVIMALGIGLLLLTDNQQKAGSREQASDAAYTLAEAALDAQVGQISSKWPSAGEGKQLELEGRKFPERCSESNAAESYCPSAGSLNAAYPSSLSPVACAAGAAEPWGSSLTGRWTTYVRDDVEAAPLFTSATEKGAVSYDLNGNEKLWVRAVGVVQCRVVSVITLVSRQLVALNFPANVAAGNWFKVTNEGNKVIVNTAGEPPGEPGPISMRCQGVSECESWNVEKKQISPDTTKGTPTPSVTLTEEQLASMKAQAQALGSLHSAANGTCPKKVEELSGQPAYVEGCGALKLTDGVANSKASPGFLVLADGTVELKGNAEFFGEIYARNPSNSSGAVVVLGGTAQVVGGIDVDGNGGIEFGSSKANLIYEPRAAKEAKTYAGATPTRNTFRVLPINQ